MVQHTEKQHPVSVLLYSSWENHATNLLPQACIFFLLVLSVYFHSVIPFFHRSTPQPHPPLIKRWHHSCSNFLYYTSPHCWTTVICSDIYIHPFICILFWLINNNKCVARFWKCYGKHSLVMFFKAISSSSRAEQGGLSLMSLVFSAPAWSWRQGIICTWKWIRKFESFYSSG